MFYHVPLMVSTLFMYMNQRTYFISLGFYLQLFWISVLLVGYICTLLCFNSFCVSFVPMLKLYLCFEYLATLSFKIKIISFVICRILVFLSFRLSCAESFQFFFEFLLLKRSFNQLLFVQTSLPRNYKICHCLM